MATPLLDRPKSELPWEALSVLLSNLPLFFPFPILIEKLSIIVDLSMLAYYSTLIIKTFAIFISTISNVNPKTKIIFFSRNFIVSLVDKTLCVVFVHYFLKDLTHLLGPGGCCKQITDQRTDE